MPRHPVSNGLRCPLIRPTLLTPTPTTDPLTHHTGGDAMTQTAPGWYPDPQGAPVLRWWEQGRWTSATKPLPRAPYLWRLVWLPFALGMAIFYFLPIHESVFGSEFNCGNALSAVQKSVNADADPAVRQVAQGLVDGCVSDGQTHLLISGGFLVAGLVAVAVTKRWERERV